MKNYSYIHIFNCLNCAKEKCTKTKQKTPAKYCSRICVGIASRKTKEEKFQTKKITYEKNVIMKEGCWDWKGALNYKGYAVLAHGIKAYRLSWEIHNEPIPEGMHVLHKRDNRKCTNPDHLFLGTNADNLADMQKKGRRASKLKEAQVKQIKILLKENDFSYTKIAQKFGVGRKCISAIHQEKTWKHVKLCP